MRRSDMLREATTLSMLIKSAMSTPRTTHTGFALPINRLAGRALIRNGRKMTDRPNSVALEAIQNQSPRV